MMRNVLRPAFEALENRDVPSVTLQTLDNGHTLKITGTGAWENVQIVENQQTGMLDVTYFKTPRPNSATIQTVNQLSFSNTEVTKVIVDLKGGNDSFSYSLAEGSHVTVARQWLIDLGAGNDSLVIDTGKVFDDSPELLQTLGLESSEGLTPDDVTDAEFQALSLAPLEVPTIQAATGFTIHAGTGNDTLDVNLGEIRNRAAVRLTTMLGDGNDVFELSSNYDVTGSGTLLVDVNGGAGKDAIFTSLNSNIGVNSLVDLVFRGGSGADKIDLSYNGRNDGRLNHRQFGGAGMDVMSYTTQTHPDSQGLSSFMIMGQADHDVMTYQTLNGDDATLISALIDGGTNRNVAKISRDIAIFNCTHIFRLDPMPPWE